MTGPGRFTRPSPRHRRPEWWGLGAFGVFTLLAVAGYATFGLHPEWLPADGFGRSFYPRSFAVSARLQIVLGAAVLFGALALRSGLRWLPAFFAVYALSFLSEHLGTGFGLPFGSYAYTGLLGPRLLGRVPLLIPLSWFLTLVPAYGLAAHRFDGSDEAWKRTLLAVGLLVAWDLALDPAMSYLTPYWVWEDAGSYYGMPWVNLAGWTLTGLVLAGALELFGSRSWARSPGPAWLAAFYGIVVFMPLGMVAAGGLWGSVAATAAVLLLLAGLLASPARTKATRAVPSIAGHEARP